MANMTNANVNLTQKLFAYIEHGVDITPEIKKNYASSLIFIGDESQIYNPGMDTYVGIGQTAYTNTLSWISTIDATLGEMKKTQGAYTISKIYGQWDAVDYAASNVQGDSANTYTATNNLTIKGIGDYDPVTRLGYTSYTIGSTVSKVTTPSYYGTSGITVKFAHAGNVTNILDDNGVAIATYNSRNVLTIDDSLTWAYIANAYSYTLDYARQWGTAEANRIYHNLLGDSQTIYVPLSYADAILASANPGATIKWNDDKTAIITSYGLSYSANPIELYYKLTTSDPVDYSTGGLYGEDSSFPKGTYVWTKIDNNSSILTNSSWTTAEKYKNNDVTPVVYAKHTVYDSTYNINLADGIQTLKEVAYLLDTITDGYGDTNNYISKTKYNSLPANEKAAYVRNTAVSDAAIEGDKDDSKAYVLKSAIESSGIQLAYSITSNRYEIEHLDHRTDKIEDGTNTVRTLMGTGSKFANVSIIASNQDAIQKFDDKKDFDEATGIKWSDTYNAYVRNLNTILRTTTGDYHTAYSSGDVQIKLNLDYTQSYYSTNEVVTNTSGTYTFATTHTNGDAVIGYFVKADNTNLNTAKATYYTFDGTSMSPAATVDTNIITNSNINYYWLPNSKAVDIVIEDQYEVVDNEKLISLQKQSGHGNDDYYYYTGTTYQSVKLSGIPKVKDGQTAIEGLTDEQKWNYPTIYITKYYENVTPADGYHAVMYNVNGSNDAIATASWVTAYITDSVSAILTNTENLKSELIDYVDARIDAIDGESTAKASEVAFSYVQDNGFVSLGYRELPSAYINSRYEVWGDTTSTDYQKEYVKVPAAAKVEGEGYDKAVLIDSLIDFYSSDVTTTDDVTTTLAALADNYIHQVYYISGKSYKIVTAASELPKSGTALDIDNTYVLDTDNTFITVSNYNGKDGVAKIATSTPSTAFDSAEFGHRTLYKAVNKYEEINIENLVGEYNASGKYIIKGIGSLNADGSIQKDVTFTATTELYCISKTAINSAKKSIKYLSTTTEHYTYNGNGNGENTFEVTAHLTNIEDATETNTGLVDAYDVKTYIENYCSWVNISASVDKTKAQSKDVTVFTELSLAEAKNSTSPVYQIVSKITDSEGSTLTATKAGFTPSYYMTTNGKYLAEAKITLTALTDDEKTNAVSSTVDSKTSYTTTYKYFTRKYNTDNGLINPNNLTTTKYNAENQIKMVVATITKS